MHVVNDFRRERREKSNVRMPEPSDGQMPDGEIHAAYCCRSQTTHRVKRVGTRRINNLPSSVVRFCGRVCAGRKTNLSEADSKMTLQRYSQLAAAATAMITSRFGLASYKYQRYSSVCQTLSTLPYLDTFVPVRRNQAATRCCSHADDFTQS